MFKKLLKPNAELVCKKPKLVLIAALVLTVLAGVFSANLSMELSWLSLAPQNSPAVKEYQEIIEDFPSLDSIVVLVESDDYEMMNIAAKETAQKLGELDEYVNSVTAGVDRDFMIENSMMFMSDDEVEIMGYLFSDTNLNSMYQFMYMLMDETAKEAAKGTLSDEEIAYAAAMFKGVSGFFEETNAALENDMDDEKIKTAIEDIFTGSELMTSPDGKMTMLTIQPSFDMMDEVMLLPGVNSIEGVLKEIDAKYDNVSVRGTGMHIVARDEIESVTNDSYVATVLSIILILALLYFAFRSWIAPVFTVTPLLFGIVWSMGIIGLAIGRLNMMTVFAVAMLIGLGVDYAIHMYSSYTERRSVGIAKEEAITHAITHTGPSIIVGALTTAVAFFALNISELQLLSELGTVMGIGIITTLAAVFWILPALIMVKKERDEKMRSISGNFMFIGKAAKGIYKVKYVVLVIIIIGAVFMGYQATTIGFDMNLMNLEPVGLESIELMEYMVEKYDLSSTSFSIQVDSLDEVYRLQEELEAVDGVAEVVSVASILPDVDEQEDALEAVNELKKALTQRAPVYPVDEIMLLAVVKEIKNVSSDYKQTWDDNSLAVLNDDDFIKMDTELDKLIEQLQSEDNQKQLDELSEAVDGVMQEMMDKMLSVNIVRPSDLPDEYKSQFLSRDENKYLMTIYSDFDIWSILGTEQGDKFLDDLASVDESITGTPIFMMDLYEAVGEELLMMGIILIIILLVILISHFKSIKYAVLAFLPLAFTMVYMLGTMSLLNIQFNMINFLVILLIIGIGLDDGVHILHHYKEGERDIKMLFAKVGRAIFLTTVTTVFGFGSLSFSSYRGIAGLGVVLAIGVSLALVFTIIVLPIFLRDEGVEKDS